jgi:hypothetical protein
LAAGPTYSSVRDVVRRVERRIDRLGISYSQTFEQPADLVRFFGVQWDLDAGRRGLPVETALQYRKWLVDFARSRGPVSLGRWRRLVGIVGWVATVASVDPARRLALLTGLRAAQHIGSAVPGSRARREARRHADAAMRFVRIDAPAESGSTVASASQLSHRRHWYVSDAAVPGAVAVVHFGPGAGGRLVYWRATSPSESAVGAELEGVQMAASLARGSYVERPVLVTDSRAVWSMVRRGVARNPRHHEAVRIIRSAAAEAHVVWVPSESNVADAASRAASVEEAEVSARVAGPLPGGPKRAGAARLLCFRLRRYGRSDNV